MIESPKILEEHARILNVYTCQIWKQTEKNLTVLLNVCSKLAKNNVMNNELIRFENTARKDYSVIVSMFVGWLQEWNQPYSSIRTDWMSETICWLFSKGLF